VGATAASLRHDLPQGAILDKSKGEQELEVFRSFKGDVETLLSPFAHHSLAFDARAAEYYQPGRSARVLLNGEPIAQFGALDPQLAAQRKIRQEIFIAEINAEWLLALPLREIRYQALPKFPSVERDFSFIFADEVTFNRIEEAVTGLGMENLRSFVPVEIFRGGAVPPGSYSLLLRAKFQSFERTLREDEVGDWAAKIVKKLAELGGTQRA
jgi:phenylalanyl-tRNA synthetase beta chain